MSTFERIKDVDERINAVPVPKHYNSEMYRSGLRYKAQPDDIFIVTYPKSGTTWMETIVFGLLNDGRSFDDDIDFYVAQTPFIDRGGEESVETMSRPGSNKTHYRFDYVPYHPQAKYICVIRNPKDVCVSAYRYFMVHANATYFDSVFDNFFETFINGKALFGDYFEYLRAMWSHKDEQNVLIVSFERMNLDLPDVIRQVAQFLEVKLTDNMLEKIMTHSSFDYMKEKYNVTRNAYFAKYPEHPNACNHPMTLIRKGIHGDWSTHMNDEQIQRLNKVIADNTQDMPGLETFFIDHN